MAEFEPRQAFEHIDKLAYEIGPRLAGTRGEQQAAEYIQKQLESYGYKVEAQEFDFVDRAARTQIGAVLLATAFIVTAFPSRTHRPRRVLDRSRRIFIAAQAHAETKK